MSASPHVAAARAKAQPIWYLVANGQNALVFHEVDNKLEQIADITPKEKPSTSSRRTSGHQPGGQGSVYYTSNPADQENGHDEAMFMGEVAHWLKQAASNNNFKTLVIAAAPKALGQLRTQLDPSLKNKVTREIDKDYTNIPLAELEAALL